MVITIEALPWQTRQEAQTEAVAVEIQTNEGKVKMLGNDLPPNGPTRLPRSAE